jgi:hypothetical protein
VGDMELMRFLVYCWSESVSAKDSQRDMPLHWAARAGCTEVVEFLEDIMAMNEVCGKHQVMNHCREVTLTRLHLVLEGSNL